MDYGIWGRRRRAIRGVNWLILVVPQILVAAIVCPIWNPIARAAGAIEPASISANTHPLAMATTSHDWLGGFLTLFWWNLRDLVACDFVVLPLLVLCPLLYFKRKSPWLLRAPLSLMIFLGAIAFFTAHPVGGEGNAEVRYLAPLLPLCIGIGILAVWAMQPLSGWVRAILLVVAGFSMFLAPGSSAATPVVKSSAVNYFAELWQPASEPYSPLAQWITTHVPARSTGVCHARLVHPADNVGCARAYLRLATERPSEIRLHRSPGDLFQGADRAGLPHRVRAVSG